MGNQELTPENYAEILLEEKYKVSKGKSLWWERNIAKYGSEEAVRRVMSEGGKRVKNRPGGYFKTLAKTNPGKLKELSKNAVNKRWEEKADTSGAEDNSAAS